MNEKHNRGRGRGRDRSSGWAWRKHSLRFGKCAPNDSENVLDRELERIQIEKFTKGHAAESFEKTS